MGTATATTAATSADTGTATTFSGGSHVAPTWVVTCAVRYNNTPYYNGPGFGYQQLGTVNAGQYFNAHGVSGEWYLGDLWGARSDVWIHGDSLSGCFLP